MSNAAVKCNRLRRVMRLDEDELVIDGGRIRLQLSRNGARTVAVSMLLDPSVKVEQRPVTATIPLVDNVAV